MKDYYGTAAIDYGDFDEIARKYKMQYLVISANEPGGMIWLISLHESEDAAQEFANLYSSPVNGYWLRVREGEDVFAHKLSGHIGGSWVES